jgi:Ca2+-binding EF-hand superfamily protein
MKRTTMIGAVLAALLATTAGVAIAQSAGQGMMQGEEMMEGEGPMGDGPMMGGRGMRGDGVMVMFAEIDANGDGSVTAEEIDAYRAARFAALDADGNGTVSRQEFMDHAAAQVAERAGTMFDRLDADGDGTLTRDVIEARRGPGPDAAVLIERFDADGDGAVSEEEIAVVQERMMERHEGRGDRMGHRGGRHGEGMDGDRGGWFGWHRDG